MKTRKELEQLARTIQVVIAGAGGVFTNNRELEGAPHKGKWRSHYDGQGVSLLRAIGIKLVIVTGESGENARYIHDMVNRWNSLPSSLKAPSEGGWTRVTLFTGVIGQAKEKAIKGFLETIEIPFERCAGMGHDIVHAELLRKVALPVIPADADPMIKAWAEKNGAFVTERSAGNGAFRDFVNFVFACRGIDPFSLPTE